MSDTPVPVPRGGCAQAPFLILIAAIFLACVAGPYIYFVRDYDYVQQTARDVQAVGVFTARALAGGLVALIVVATCGGLVAVWGLRVRWGSRLALESNERIEIARAQHQVLPEGLTSMTVTHNHNQRLPAPAAAAPALVEPAGEQKVIDAEDAPPALPTPPEPSVAILPQLQARGLITPGSLFVGLGEEAPARIDMQACGFVAVGGRSRSGKTTTAKLLVAQAAQLGWHIFLCDPFPTKPDGLMSLCRPLSGHIEHLAGEKEMAHTIQLVDKIGRRRMDGHNPNDRPVLLVIEEFTNVVIRKMLPADILNLLPAMAMAYAAVGVHGMIIGHDFSRNMLGEDYGATLRRACTHRIAHRMAPDAAELIVPSPAHARQVAELRPGRVLFWGEDSPELVSVPEITGPDLVFAAGSTPPRPYPRQKGAAATPAPAPAAAAPQAAPQAAPVAQASPAPRVVVPPTVKFPDPTMVEEIVNVLALFPEGLTAAVIADRLQADPATVKTRLAEMKGESLINARVGKGRGAPFVYSLVRRPPSA